MSLALILDFPLVHLNMLRAAALHSEYYFLCCRRVFLGSDRFVLSRAHICRSAACIGMQGEAMIEGMALVMRVYMSCRGLAGNSMFEPPVVGVQKNIHYH